MHLENRMIAMLDVLGFSNRIRTRPELLQTMEKYAEMIKLAKQHMFSPQTVEGSPNQAEPNFEFGQFVFDTLVLVSHPLDIFSAYRFIFATILLMETFYKEKFPLRGCIGIGDLCIDETSQVFLSDAFKRLRIEEEGQQWSGCVLLEEVEKFVLDAVLGSTVEVARFTEMPRSSLMHWFPVPVKEVVDPPRNRWCLNWSYFLSSSTVDAGLEYMEGDPVKRVNTAKYIQFLNTLPDDAQVLPDEFFPAKTVKFMKARAGVRLKFRDKDDNAAEPGCQQWTFSARTD